MRLSLRGVSATLGAVALVGTMAIGAATPTHAASAPGVVALGSASAPSAVPNSNIVVSRKSHKAVYRPATLNGGTHTSPPCSTSNENVTVTNKTKASQTITYQGSPFFTLGAGQGVGICFYAANTYVFGLQSNAHAKLTVTIS